MTPICRWAFFHALVLLAMQAPMAADAQSITGGELRGTVSSNSDPLEEAHVAATDRLTGLLRETFTERDGAFELGFLPPGEYDVFVEALGHRPRLVRGVPVRPGQSVTLPVRLAPASPPVERVDTVAFPAGVGSRNRPGLSRWLSASDLSYLPDRRREFTELADLATSLDSELAAEGLPGRLTEVVVDGVRFFPARHPSRSDESLVAVAFPRGAVSRGEVLLNPQDIEWAGAAGALLSGMTERARRDFSFGAYGAWSGAPLWSSDFFDDPDAGFNSFWGGLDLEVPLVRDTANLRVGVEGQRIQAPAPAFVGVDTTILGAVAPALDSVLPGTTVPAQLAEMETVSGYGRLDWALSDRTSLQVRTNATRVLSAGSILGSAYQAPDRLPRAEGTDVSAGVTVASQLSERISLEVRAGFASSSRDYPGVEDRSSGDASGSRLPGTAFVTPGFLWGTHPTLPAEVRRRSFTGSPVVHFRYGTHHLKGGADLEISSFDYRYLYQRPGTYFLSTATDPTSPSGAFVQATGRPGEVSFTAPTFGAFVQDAWDAAPGFRLILGLRYDLEQLPSDDIRVNGRWEELTGLSNTEIEDVDKVSTRVGFAWNVGERDRTFVWGGAGVQYGGVEPAVLNELLTLDGGVEIRRATGTLDAWPLEPDPDALVAAGPRLALLGPQFEAPRTSRGTLGISQALSENTFFHLSGSYRDTDFLVRRSDLNRAPIPSGRDQFGRPIFGTLTKEGSVLAARTSSNRRFSEFDYVWARNADGWSEFKGVTAAVEHSGSNFDLFASYTFSETRDNLLGARRGPEAEMNPFDDSSGAEEWSDEGTSDFDLPHRVVAGASVRAPGAASFRLSGIYRYRSGYPLTPRFRDGVDANGDGSAFNDPAFVPATAEVDELAPEWPCLTEQTGSFAERNSCRAPGVHNVDLRLSVRIPGLEGRSEIFIDGLNLLEPETGIRDEALLLVDPDQDLTADPETGEVTVPFTVNPGFGRLTIPSSLGRMFRVGMRINY